MSPVCSASKHWVLTCVLRKTTIILKWVSNCFAGLPVDDISEWEQAIPDKYDDVIDKLTTGEKRARMGLLGNHPKRDPWFVNSYKRARTSGYGK